MKTNGALLGGAALGATLTYFCDRALGKRRRAIARDEGLHWARVLLRTANAGVRDLGNRIDGMVREAQRLIRTERVEDPVLEGRVRTEIGRFCSHPNVEVIVNRGCVTLMGPVVDHEERAIIRAAKPVRGVLGVNN